VFAGMGDFAASHRRRAAITAALAHAARLWDRVSAAVESRVAIWAVALGTAVVYAVESIAWPLADVVKRDSFEYVLYYLEFVDRTPLFPALMLGRTPIAPLVDGAALELGGPTTLEVVMGLAYVVTVVVLFVTARALSPAAGLLTVGLLLLATDVAALYHQVSSDALFATAAAAAVGVLGWAWRDGTLGSFALAGAAVALAGLVRPSGLVLVPVVAAGVLLRPGSVRGRLRLAAATLLPALAVLGAWASVNLARYDSFTVAGSPTPPPLYRMFVEEHLVDPSNGPASAELGEEVARWVRREPYRSYGITEEKFFSEATNFMSWDLNRIAEERWGAAAAPGKLQQVAWEAFRAHPGRYLRSVLDAADAYLRDPYFYPAPDPAKREVDQDSGDRIVVGGRSLLDPPYGQLILRPRIVLPPASSTRRSYVYDWSSLDAPRLRFTDPGLERRYVERQQQLAEVDASLPARKGNAWLAAQLNRAMHHSPRPLTLLVVGLVALVVRRPARSSYLVCVALCGLAIVAIHALSMPAFLEYSLPASPLFVLFAAGALLGRRPGRPAAPTRNDGLREPYPAAP
jgi:hypothetical protein